MRSKHGAAAPRVCVFLFSCCCCCSSCAACLGKSSLLTPLFSLCLPFTVGSSRKFEERKGSCVRSAFPSPQHALLLSMRGDMLLLLLLHNGKKKEAEKYFSLLFIFDTLRESSCRSFHLFLCCLLHHVKRCQRFGRMGICGGGALFSLSAV